MSFTIDYPRRDEARNGLVVMLDLAGRRIAELEAGVTRLEAAILDEQNQRRILEGMLDRLRGDTGDVNPSSP